MADSFEILHTEEVDDAHSLVAQEEAQAAAETEVGEAAQMGTQVCFDAAAQATTQEASTDVVRKIVVQLFGPYPV